jgi:hypothetical protein
MISQLAWLRGGAATAAVLAIWSILAVRSPDLTYHFAPLIAAGVWPVLGRHTTTSPLRPTALAALGGFAMTVAVSVLLAGAGYLQGPTFWGDGHALSEAILFAALGAAGGAAVGLRAAKKLSTN